MSTPAKVYSSESIEAVRMALMAFSEQVSDALTELSQAPAGKASGGLLDAARGYYRASMKAYPDDAPRAAELAAAANDAARGLTHLRKADFRPAPGLPEPPEPDRVGGPKGKDDFKLVGERGPEVLSVGAPATVMSNNALQAIQGGAQGLTINSTVQGVNDPAMVRRTSAETIAQAAPTLMKMSTNQTMAQSRYRKMR